MSKNPILLPQITEPVVVENCQPQKYYLISTGDMTVRISPATWSKIREHYARTLGDNPALNVINYELYLNREKSYKLISIVRENYGMDIKLNILEMATRKNHIVDYKKDIINVESKEYHDKKIKYFEENRAACNERSRRHYYAKKQAMQENVGTKPEASWRLSEVTKEEVVEEVKQEAPKSDFNMEMMAFLTSMVDTEKLNAKKEELKKMQEKCNLMQKMLDFFS